MGMHTFYRVLQVCSLAVVLIGVSAARKEDGSTPGHVYGIAYKKYIERQKNYRPYKVVFYKGYEWCIFIDGREEICDESD